MASSFDEEHINGLVAVCEEFCAQIRRHLGDDYRPEWFQKLMPIVVEHLSTVIKRGTTKVPRSVVLAAKRVMNGKAAQVVKKQSKGPKKPVTGFMTFCKLAKIDMPEGCQMTELTKRRGEVWKSLSDEEKKPYMEEADKDKARYEREKQEYNLLSEEEKVEWQKDYDEKHKKPKKKRKAPVKAPKEDPDATEDEAEPQAKKVCVST